MWPWLPERVVVVHIPCVLTYLLTYELSAPSGSYRYGKNRSRSKRAGSPRYSEGREVTNPKTYPRGPEESSRSRREPATRATHALQHADTHGG